MRGRIGSILCAVALAAGLAACGGDGGGEQGPAAVTPADAAGYFELAVRPEGEAREGAEQALAKVLDTQDPGRRIVSELERSAAADGADFDWERDIEPWLGERIGSFPSSLAGESEAVVIAETTDSEQALEFVRSQEDAGGEEREYEGTSYELDADGDAFGVVDEMLVFGSPDGFEQAVDASKGDSLADDESFQDTAGDLSEQSLGMLYAVPRTFLEAIPADEIDTQGRDFVLKAIGDASDEPVVGDVTASADGVEMELSSGGSVETGQSALLPDLPSDAWLALGLAEIGSAVGQGLESVDAADEPGLSADAIRSQLRSQAGIDLDRDVVEALGDGALFVTGTSQASLGGALVIESENPQATATLLGRLQRLIRSQSGGQVRVRPLASAGGQAGFQLTGPELAQPVTVAQANDRLVIGYGRASVSRALAGASGGAGTLASDPLFQQARQQVGELGVDAFLALGPVFELAESSGAASDPEYRQAQRYLDSLSYLVLGSGSEGDRATLRLVLGLN